jgi:hypothetical protein
MLHSVIVEAPLDDNKKRILSQKALLIYIDQVILDATAKNEKLRTENSSLQAAQDLLLSVQIWNQGTMLKEINFLDDCESTSQESSTHLIFAMEEAVETPLEDIHGLISSISGIRFPSAHCNFVIYPPAITFHDDGTTDIDIFLANDFVSVTGSLMNISGTVKEVQSMIDCNRHRFYFRSLGCSQRCFEQDVCLDRSTVSLQTIKIAKHAVQSTLDLELNLHELIEDNQYEDELQIIISKTNTGHKGLCAVAKAHNTLETCNTKLKLSQDCLQTLELYYFPSERDENPNYSLSFNLLDGRIRNTVQGELGWMLEPTSEEETIPLVYLSHMKIKLGNIPWRAATDSFAEPYFSNWKTYFTANALMVMEYGTAISAVFSFDESLDIDAFPPDGMLRYVRHCLASVGHGNVTTNYQGPEPELTMRLLWVEVRLRDIQNHLDALGVKAVSEDEPSL